MAHLINTQVGIRRDYSAACEVDALAGQIASEPSLLALEALNEAPTAKVEPDVMSASAGEPLNAISVVQAAGSCRPAWLQKGQERQWLT